MASEAVETAAPAANGDLHTEEDEKSKMRPADIDAVSHLYVLSIDFYNKNSLNQLNQ